MACVGQLRRGDDQRFQRAAGHFQRHLVVAQGQPLGQPQPFDHVVDPFQVVAAPRGQLRDASLLPQRPTLFELQPAAIGGVELRGGDPQGDRRFAVPGHGDRRGDRLPGFAAVGLQGLGGVLHPLQRRAEQFQRGQQRLRRGFLATVGHVDVAGQNPVAGRQFDQIGGDGPGHFDSCRVGFSPPANPRRAKAQPTHLTQKPKL